MRQVWLDKHTISTEQPSHVSCTEAAWKLNNSLRGLREGPLWSGDMRFDLWRRCVRERERARRRRRPYGLEDGTVIWPCSVRKCKCLCSDVYTFVSVPERSTDRPPACLHGCLLCHKLLPVHQFQVVGRVLRLCFLLSRRRKKPVFCVPAVVIWQGPSTKSSRLSM